MYDTIKLLFEICLFKKKPQDLPYSVFLLGLMAGIYIAVRVLMLSMHFDSLGVLMQIAVDLVLVFGCVWLMLYLARKLGRFCQVLSAVLGTDALISFFAIPGVATMELGHGGLAVFLLVLSLIVWHWAITGHIISNALEKSLSFSLGLAFLYLFGTYQVMAFLFPEVAGVK
jgi:hypothetical protein